VTRIVTTHYRYKRPLKRKQPVAIEGPEVVNAADPAAVAGPRQAVIHQRQTQDR
jgi:hypothetical protein